MKASLATSDEAMARVRWNRVHEQVEGLVPMGHVLAAEKARWDRGRQTVDCRPPDAVQTIAARARHDIPAEHDRTWIDPSFTSPLTGVVARLMREAGRAASPDPVDDALRLRDARAALASRQLGLLAVAVEEAEVTDPRLVASSGSPPSTTRPSRPCRRRRPSRASSTSAWRGTAPRC